jgi:hypothetical protein
MFIARLILGSLAAGIVWLSMWPLNSLNIEYAVLAGISVFALAALASWLSVKKNERKKLAPIAFSVPFTALAAASIPAFTGGGVRPFIFWMLCTAAALAISVVSDLFTFRKIVEEEEA